MLAYTVLALAAGIWAVLDRLRDRRTMALLVRWLVVSLILTLPSTFIPQMGGSPDWDVWLSDLVMLGPFTILQVLVPAAIGIGVAALVTRLRRPSSTGEPQP